MEFRHDTFGGCVVKELTQRDVEKLMGGLARSGAADLIKVEYDGAAVRLGIELGLFESPVLSVDMVDGMKPARVRWLADCLGEALADALSVDPLA